MVTQPEALSLAPAAAVGKGVGDVGGKSVAGVQGGVAVVAFEVRAVLRKDGAGHRDLVKRVAPGVVDLRGDAAKIGQSQSSLERVIIAGRDRAKLVDVAQGRVSGEKGTTSLLDEDLRVVRRRAEGQEWD